MADTSTLVAPAKVDNDPSEETLEKGKTLLTNRAVPDSSLTEEGKGQLPHVWMAGMTAEQKADEEFVKRFEKFQKGIPDLTKAYAELETKLTDSVTVPSDEATDEEIGRYRKAIGVPDKSEDYELEKIEMPDGVEVDDKMQGNYLAEAHKLGLSQTQAKAMHEWYMTTVGLQLAEATKVVKTSHEEAEKAMTERHAKDPDAMVYLERGFAAVATPELTTVYNTTGLGNHPAIVDMHIWIGKNIGDDKFVDGSRGVGLETSPVGKRSDAEISALMYPQK